MFYIIGDTSVITNAIDVFSYSPTGAGSYTITYTISIPAGSPTVSSLQITGQTDIEVGSETDASLYGSHTVRLTGTMDDAEVTTKYEEFLLNLIKLEGSVADQTYRIEPAGTAKSIAFAVT